MQSLSSLELREKWNNFWIEKNHKYLSEVSLLSSKESTSLFNVAWMQQLIPYLMWKPHKLGNRLFNIQRCIRTNDVDEVWDASHLSFFEMMWNWSLGDYFKQDSVKWSYEFLVDVLWFDTKKLAVTVFEGNKKVSADNETKKYWLAVGIPEHKISAMWMKNNRWTPGSVGPCGPDTEIFYRVWKGEFPSIESNPKDDEANWLEIWNNVFMEYYANWTEKLTQLKNQNVDTGMWFERMCKVLQWKETVYETDLFWPIIELISKYTWLSYLWNERKMRIIADHLRTALVLVNDGCISSNVGAGYVLRMLIRRMYYNFLLLKKEGDIDWLVSDVLAFFSSIYPLSAKNIDVSILWEISQFKKTIDNWIKLLDQLLSKNTSITWEDAFKLYDTYWFPFEITKEICNEKNIFVDEKWFNKALEDQKEKSRNASKNFLAKDIDRSKYLEWVVPTKFIGYDTSSTTESKIIKDFVVDEQRVLIFDKTPFYAESGGQASDFWKVIMEDWSELEIINAIKYEGVFLHLVK